MTGAAPGQPAADPTRAADGTPVGIAVVDKPAGWTSHDVVARLRRVYGTRRVGHAGTLDPFATGVLLVGVGPATRLLGHLAAGTKSYLATAVLGVATATDDATGEVTARRPAGDLSAERVRAALGRLTGPIEQVPPAYSAVQRSGQRAYAAARAGRPLDLDPRPVTVHRLELLGWHPEGDTVRVELAVDCSAGTYVRALARDLGADLGAGGHLTALRRTRVGRYTLEQAAPPDAPPPLHALGDVAAATFPRRDVDEAAARRLSHGIPLPEGGLGEAPVAVFGPDGRFVALVRDSDGAARPLAVFPNARI